MKKKLIFIPILIIIGYFSYTLLFSGKSEKSNGLNLIPKNTPAVGVMSIGEIIHKMAYEKLEKLDLEYIHRMQRERERLIEYYKSGPDKSALAVRFLENPFDGFGLDLNQDIFFFTPINKNSTTYFCISGGISDAEELEDVIKDLKKITMSYENYIKTKKNDDYTIATYYNRDAAVALAWDDTKFVFISTTDGRPRKSDIKNIMNEANRLFNLSSEDKLTSINSFNTFYKENTDMCFWASAEGMDKKRLNKLIDPQLNKVLKGAGIKIADLLETNYTGFFDFNDDYISIKTSLSINDEIQDIVKDRLGPETSEISMEFKMTFDESGENTLFALLKTFLITGDYFYMMEDAYYRDDYYDDDYYDDDYYDDDYYDDDYYDDDYYGDDYEDEYYHDEYEDEYDYDYDEYNPNSRDYDYDYEPNRRGGYNQ